MSDKPYRVYLEYTVGAGWSAEDVTYRLRQWPDASQIIVANLETGALVNGKDWLAAVSQETQQSEPAVEFPQSQK